MSEAVTPPWKIVTQAAVPWLPVDEDPNEPLAARPDDVSSAVTSEPATAVGAPVNPPGKSTKGPKNKKPMVRVAGPGEPDPVIAAKEPATPRGVEADVEVAESFGEVSVRRDEPTLDSMNDGLDDLFADPATPVVVPPVDDPVGLDDLFGDDPEPVVTPVSHSAPVEEPVSYGATVEQPRPGAAVFGAVTPIEAEDPAVSVDVPAAVAVPDGAVVREAAVVDTRDIEVEQERARFEAQLSSQLHLYEIVDQLLSFVAQDAQLQVMVNDFILTRDIALDRHQRATLQEKVAPRLVDSNISIGNPRDIDTVFDLAYDEMIGISVVGDLWRDESVDEILIDSWDKICVERFGRIVETGRRFRSPEHALGVARRLSQLVSDRAVSRTNALVTAQLPRARVQFIWGNVAASGLAVSIRKFRDLLGMDKLLEFASLSEEMRDFLSDAVHARATILVSGGTGTGKTTMINALSEFIPDSERVITIEDSYELSLSNRHVVALQAKGRSSSDDTVFINQEDLMVASLRMRPDRIIVGEIREPSAAAVMLQAANTGHDGTMTTLHASSVSVALNNRMVSLLMRSGVGFSDEVARSEVSQAIDLVIQISRRGGRRFVSEIALVDPSYLETGLVRALPLFVGEFRARMTEGGETVADITYRQIGRIPTSSGLGIKLGDLGDVSRWTI